jgi:hypothetical protein
MNQSDILTFNLALFDAPTIFETVSNLMVMFPSNELAMSARA